jgi:hypothetical protein
MIDIDIPQFLWPLIFESIILITNRTATSLLKGKTPYKAFTDEFHPDRDNRPSVAHLRVLGCKTYVQIPKERRVISQKVTGRAEVGILVGYEGSHIFRVYVPSRRGPVESKIVRSSNVRFDEGGLITKPLPEEEDKEEADIQIPVRNRGEAANQDRQDSDLIHQRVPNMHQQHQHRSELEKVIIPELIETDSEHKKSQNSSDNEQSLPDEDEDSPAEEELKELEEMPEIEAEPEPKQKGLRTRKIYMPRPEFNRVTRRQTRHNRNTAFYTAYTAGPESSIYNDPQTIEEAKKRPDWPE